MLLLPLLLLTNDIAIYGVNFDYVIANGTTYYSEASLPSGFAVVYSGNVVKLTVTSSATSSGVDKTPSMTNTGKGRFRIYLSSVNQAPGDTDILTVYYTQWAQATASATSNNNSSATGKGFTKEQNRKAVVTVTGEDGGDSKSDPTTAISKVVKQVYHNVHWNDAGGYRWCDLPYYTEQLTAVGIAKYTGSSTGNIVQSIGSGNALNKASFHHAVYGAVLAGAQFNALNGLSDRTVNLSLTNQYGSPIEDFYSRTASGLTDTSFDVASSGTYYLTISGQSMLRKKISISLTPGSTNNIGTVSTYLGDVNGDNVINSADTALISNYLGVSTGSTRWVSGDETLSWTAEDCDLNGDGTVNTTDLAIAQANLNVVGD